MTNEEAINEIEKLDDWISKQPSLLEDWCKTSDALYIATQALKAQPCEDCISREAVDKLSRDLVHVTRDKADFLCNFWEGLNALPSVKPTYTDEEIDKMQTLEQAYVDKMVELAVEKVKRPKGKWIEVDPLGTGDKAYMCSECETGDWDVTIGEYKFCPYCGAEMEGVEDADSD